jgi:hypothetical protein
MRSFRVASERASLFRRDLSVVTLLWRARRLIRNANAVKLLRVTEAAAGLTRDDYATPDRLRGKLLTHLDGMPDVLAVTYLSTLAGALGMVRRNLDGLHVYEAFLDIDAADYTDATALREKIRGRWLNLPDDLAVSLVFIVAGSLGVLGRDSEAVALLRADLGLEPRAGRDSTEVHDELQARLMRRLAGLAPDSVVAYLSLLMPYLNDLGADAGGAAVLEASLGLRPEDYLSRELLSARLGPLIRSLTTREAPTSLLMSVAGLLDESGQRDRALALLEWHVGVDAGDYRDPAEFRRKWRTFCDANYPDIGPTLWRLWSDMLASAGRAADALVLIEADTGATITDLASPERFGPKLARRLRGVQVDTAAAYLLSLAYCLAELGHATPAGLVVDWYLRGYDNLWEVPENGDPGVTHVIPLVTLWLGLHSASEPDFAWLLCGKVVAYLRRSLLIEDLRLADRKQFIGSVESLRGEIKRIGYSWADEPAQVSGHVLEAQLWDAELSQRALFEEFLLTRIEPVAEGIPPQDRWPYAEEEPTGVGPPEFLGLSSAELSGLLASTSPEGQPAVPPRGADYSTSAGTESWLSDAEQLIRQGITTELLAEALGPGTLLVRAGFRPGDGALGWAAVRIGNDLDARVIDARIGAPGDQSRARWASLRHDLGLQIATATGAEDPESDSFPPEKQGDRLAEVIDGAVSSMIAVLDEVAEEGWGDGEWLQTLGGYLALLDSDRSSVAAREQIGTRIGALLPPPENPSGHESWMSFARTELGKLGDTAGQHLLRKSGAVGLPDEIDDVTRGFLSDMADIWPLGPLTDHFDQSTDVVFQLEDVLQQVPVAHYPLAGDVPLYSLVRSTRVSLSVLVTIMQSRIEQQFSVGARRMLALSYFPEGDGSAGYGWLLHYGHRWLARGSGHGELTCLNAAEVPPGSTGALQAALQPGDGFHVVTICGHGFDDERAQSGVLLQDGLWRGSGCDLSAVGFLLLPSCSMGRLRQAGDGDVVGMCALLALNRARSVLACRWPVITYEAIAFAHEVVASYLELSAEAGAAERGNLRARAVNIARLRFLGSTGNPRRSGVLLNTVAAFEIFGLG